MRDKHPNPRLSAALAESGWTGQQLADAVNAVAAEAGLDFCYGRSSVCHWQNGIRPRPPVPTLIAEALSRRLGRTLTPHDLGFDGSAPSRPQADEVPAELRRLAVHRQVRDRRAYTLTDPAVPRWQQNVPPPIAIDPSARPLHSAHVEGAELMARVFRDDDDTFGGGHCRRALAAYLATDVAPALQARGPAVLRRRMFRTAARLVYLCAYMCFDEEFHDGAQRYYDCALQLAAHARDPATYAVILRSMSVQARALGHHQHAVDLAETAAGIRTLSPLVRAFVYGQLAVAYASRGESGRAHDTMATAEKFLERSGNADDVIGSYHHAALSHQRAHLRLFAGDLPGAVAALRDSLRHRPPAERRSRALTTAQLAELHLTLGHLHQAVATVHDFLDDYSSLQSRRATTALRALRARLRPYATNPAVAQVLTRADGRRSGFTGNGRGVD
jgi:tetratricopeptide (TPR) repeat protein